MSLLASKKIPAILLLTLFVSCIYLLRDSNTSPGTFLRSQVVRHLADHQVSEAFCAGTSEVNDITQKERDTARGHTEYYAKKRNGNPLVTFIEGPDLGGKIGEKYGPPVGKTMIPFLVVFLIAFGGCIYFTTVWCCLNYHCCPDSKICKGPKPGGWRIPLFIAVFLFALALVIGSGIGIKTSLNFKQGGKKVLCSIGVFIEKVIDGSETEDWAGAEVAVQNFQALLGDWNNMVFKLTAAPSLTATVTASGMTATILPAQTAVQLMYTTKNYKTVNPRPDPAKATTNFYKPTYIKNLGKTRDLLLKEMSDKKSVVESSALRADLGINELRLSSAAILLVLEKAQTILTNVSKTLAIVEKNMTETGKKANTMVSAVSGGLLGLFAGNLVFGIIAIGTTVLVGWAHKGLHLSWYAISTLAVIGWLLSAILYPASLATFESCDVGNRLLDNSTFFNITMEKFVVKNMTTGEKTENGETVKDILYRCYWGDGNLIDQLGLTEVFGIFNNVFEPLDNVASLSTSVGPVQSSILIPLQQELVRNYQYGLISDAQETTDDLALLNTLTNAETNPCTQMRDVWVLNSTKCPSDAGTLFAAGMASTFNIRSLTCIGFDKWNHAQVNQRYSANTFPQPACGLKNGVPTNTYLSSFVNNFADARDSSASLFGDIASDYSSISSANELFMGSVKLATKSFDPVRTATKIAYKAMWDPTTGFIRNSNCSFFRSATEDLLDSVCVRFGNSLFSTMVMAIVVSSFGTLAAVALFLLAFKFFSERSRQEFEHFEDD